MPVSQVPGQNGQLVERDLRRAFKAMAMRYRIPTQFLRESTTGLTDTRRQMDHPSEIAWNLFTGLYFKAGGLPWSPADITPGTCFIGVSFPPPIGQRQDPAHLRGCKPSMKTATASSCGVMPSAGMRPATAGPHIFLRTSRPTWSAWSSTATARNASRPRAAWSCTRVRCSPAPNVLASKTASTRSPNTTWYASHRAAMYASCARANTPRCAEPPSLSAMTATSTGDRLHPRARLLPSRSLPAPLLVADHVGDTPHDRLLREILLLTKMNWNSAEYAEALPITLRFSRLVGAVLREVPADQEPATK